MVCKYYSSSALGLLLISLTSFKEIRSDYLRRARLYMHKLDCFLDSYSGKETESCVSGLMFGQNFSSNDLFRASLATMGKEYVISALNHTLIDHA